MAEIILYAVDEDTGPLLDWLNAEPVAWIVCDERCGGQYRWKAVDRIDALRPGAHCLWHPGSAPLVLPSREPGGADAVILDPHRGWEQTLEDPEARVPWLGVSGAGTYELVYRPIGREVEGAIGRSGFGWIGNHYQPVGQPATKTGSQWWERLRRFVKRQAVRVPWGAPGSRTSAYAFPHAYTRHSAGTHLDTNP